MKEEDLDSIQKNWENSINEFYKKTQSRKVKN